jgi:alkanesulfonate monooxygenase SsuD/methylene tetrahydromethanopterin reductase-like flavin-dependent oxidoreductase (luciferase family)
VADDAELDSLTLGDRHAMASPYYQNVPMMGRLLAEWSPHRPVGCLFLLPLWHPVLVAEQVATLATMSEAPFIIQTGIGAGSKQFAAMGASLRTRGAHLEESIRIIKALLSGETVSSERFGLTDARISPLPPHGVEWWLGAGVATALRRAADLGDAWYTDPGVTPETVAAPLADYAQFCAAAGRAPRTVVRKDVIVLRDGDRARRIGDRLVAAGYRGMTSEQLIYGGIDHVVDQLGRFDDIGISEVMVRCMSVDEADALETIECCGEVRRTLA